MSWFNRAMNVLNVAVLERELYKFAVRARHAEVNRWVMSVARNHFLGKMEANDIVANYREVRLDSTDPAHYAPKAGTLPAWAVTAIANGEQLYWFDPVGCRRRDLWKALEFVMIWFNSWKPTDTRLRRVDRISFPVAMQAAALWYKDVTTNIWNYVVDKPVVWKEYPAEGYRWVKLVSQLQFERESKLMSHCIANGGYFDKHRSGTAEYLSLRDKNNQPHVTFEIQIGDNGSRTVIQCKGKSNQKPAPPYQPFIADALKHGRMTVNGDERNIDGADEASK